MLDLYRRFGLQADLESSNTMFRNKMNNVLQNGQLGDDIFKGDILWTLCLELGLDYEHYSDARDLFKSSLPLPEYFFRIQILLNHLWSIQESRSEAKRLADAISAFLEESPLSLGYRVKIYKTKSPQIFPATSKFIDKQVIDSLDLLENKRYISISEHFEEALKELLKAKSKAQFKDVVEDLLTACDNLVKVLFQDQNLGFRQLFKEARWEKVGLNSYQKNMFYQLNDWMDKIKHDVDKNYDKNHIEAMVGMVATLFRLCLK